MKLKIKKLINVLQYDKTQSEIIVLKNDKIIIRTRRRTKNTYYAK